MLITTVAHPKAHPALLHFLTPMGSSFTKTNIGLYLLKLTTETTNSQGKCLLKLIVN